MKMRHLLRYLFLFVLFGPVLIYLVWFHPFIPVQNKHYVVAGTGNPGTILVYENDKGKLKKVKTIDTGYGYVHTVRIGDIYNDQAQHIIAGVSNSFFAEPYGCKVIDYDMVTFKEIMIDDVGDLRCKDLTIGDVDNDGKNEIVLGTHGEGIIRVYKWEKNRWAKEDLEKNFIAQIDNQEKMNHRMSKDNLPCGDCIVQTAVHIVKIGDVYNDGKNALVVTISSQLEGSLENIEEISFIKVYRKIDGKWQSEIIDRFKKIGSRGIAIGDIYNSRENVILIGTDSTSGEERGSLYAYEYKNGAWQKTLVYGDQEDHQIKAVEIGDIYRDGKQRILLATSNPNAKVIILSWNGKSFDIEKVGQIPSLSNFPDSEFYSLTVLLGRTENGSYLIIGGMVISEKDQVGWEATNKGFIAEYTKTGSVWKGTVIDKRAVLGADQSNPE